LTCSGLNTTNISEEYDIRNSERALMLRYVTLTIPSAFFFYSIFLTTFAEGCKLWRCSTWNTRIIKILPPPWCFNSLL